MWTPFIGPSRVDADPTNYMALYMRAMVQQATGRTKATLVDLARVLEMRPDFHQVRPVFPLPLHSTLALAPPLRVMPLPSYPAAC